MALADRDRHDFRHGHDHSHERRHAHDRHGDRFGGDGARPRGLGDLQSRFDPATVLRVQLTDPPQPDVFLTGTDAEAFAAALLGGTFDESNAQHYGPDSGDRDHLLLPERCGLLPEPVARRPLRGELGRAAVPGDEPRVGPPPAGEGLHVSVTKRSPDRPEVAVLAVRCRRPRTAATWHDA